MCVCVCVCVYVFVVGIPRAELPFPGRSMSLWGHGCEHEAVEIFIPGQDIDCEQTESAVD